LLYVLFQRANDHAAKVLRGFLAQKQQATNFEEYTPQQLDEVLGHLYMGVRSKDNDMYRGTSLNAIRYGLNRYLQGPPYNRKIHILTDPEFTSSNELFAVAKKELKAEGKCDIRHTPAISTDDMMKIYRSKWLNPNTPTGLANKVQFDVRFFFFCRGLENMDSMTRDTFEVRKDKDGQKHVIKVVDELTKNHKEHDTDMVTGVMVETGTPFCPVASFEKYISLLNGKSNRLWQYPSQTFTDEDTTWYENRPIGKNTLRKFMPGLSTKCDLSKHYTNHSIRATGATILADAGFNPIDIMSGTGHKSLASLKPYQKTSLERKKEMATCMFSQLDNTHSQLVPQARRAVPSVTSNQYRSATASSTTATVTSGAYEALQSATTVAVKHTTKTSHAQIFSPARKQLAAHVTDGDAGACPTPRGNSASQDTQALELSQQEIDALFDTTCFGDDELPPSSTMTSARSAPTFFNCNLSHATINISFNK
jgi:hypothetical protein